MRGRICDANGAVFEEKPGEVCISRLFSCLLLCLIFASEVRVILATPQEYFFLSFHLRKKYGRF